MNNKNYLNSNKKAMSFMSSKMGQFLLGIIVLIVVISLPSRIYDFTLQLNLEQDEQACKIFGNNLEDFTISDFPVFCTNSPTKKNKEPVDISTLDDEAMKFICGVDSDEEIEIQGFDRVEFKDEIENRIKRNNCREDDSDCTCIQQAFLAQENYFSELIDSSTSGSGNTLGDIIGGGINQEESLLQQITNYMAPYINQREANGIPASQRNYELSSSLSGTDFESTYNRLDQARLVPHLETMAEEYGIDPAILFFVIHQESKGIPNAISPTGCTGISQFCYGTATDEFPRIGSSGIVHDNMRSCSTNPGRSGVFSESKCPTQGNDVRLDPFLSIEAQASFLSRLLEERDGDVYTTLARYNGGNLYSSCRNLASEEAKFQCVYDRTYAHYGTTQKAEETSNYARNIYSWINKYSIFGEVSGSEGSSEFSSSNLFSNAGVIEPRMSSELRPSEVLVSDLSDYITYAGAKTRKYGLAEDLEKILALTGKKLGIRVNIISGGQPSSGENRLGSHRHDFGNAADIDLYLKITDTQERKLSINDPEYIRFIELAFSNGVKSGSMAENYMGPGRMHLDITDDCAFYPWKKNGITRQPYSEFVSAARRGISNRGGTIHICGTCTISACR